MTTENIRYWGYRINKALISFFRAELEQGRLRQGWGGPGQDLRGSTLKSGARRNLRMLREVKKGHILLVPRLPEWNRVAIVEATEDWESGYRFEDPAQKDYSHIFPARLLKSFVREAAGVSGDLRASLRNIGRFWNMDRLGPDIEVLRQAQQADLDAKKTDAERLGDAVQEAFSGAFDAEKFGTSVYDRLNREFDNTRWENVLVRVLATRYPAPCKVDRVGGRSEKEHGTDILVSLPGVGEGPRHAIAVQVKDYSGVVGHHPVDQIIKAEWWNGQDAYSVVEKVVILTKARRGENTDLVDYAKKKKVRLVFAEDLQEILTEYAKRTMGLTSSD